MKKTVKGSYTVEAALLFPFIIFLIIGLIYLGFYLHDKSKIEGIVHESLLSAKYLILNETDLTTGVIDYEAYINRGILYVLSDDFEEKEERIYNEVRDNLSKGFFLAEVETLEIEVKHNLVNIKTTISMEIPFLQVKQLFTNNSILLSQEESAVLGDNEEFIRTFDVFFGVSQKVPLVEKTLEKLSQILNKLR